MSRGTGWEGAPRRPPCSRSPEKFPLTYYVIFVTMAGMSRLICLSLLALAMFGLLMLVLPSDGNSQTGDMKLHEIGSYDNIRMLKMIHAGCEIFVVVGDSGHSSESLISRFPTPISVATGRGCN